MTTGELAQQEVAQLLELFVLYSKKNAFTIEEYGDVYTVYSKLKEFLVKNQATDKTAKLELEQKELGYLVKVMDICSQRAPVEVQNYKTISNLYEKLSGMVIKEDEPTSITELEETKEE